MLDLSRLTEAASYIERELDGFLPACGLILGSGWSDVADAFEIRNVISYDDIPGLGATGVVGHAGRLVAGELHGVPSLVFQGRRHYYEGEGWTPVAIPVFTMIRLKVRYLLATNAAGGLRADLQPGHLMVIRDHINGMGSNPLIGPHIDAFGPRFPDLSHAYDLELIKALKQAAQASGQTVADGVYYAGSGPFYETPSEIKAYRTLGADAVGMSTVPEVMLAHAGGIRTAGLSCITNLAAGISPTPLSHEEVTETTRQSMARMKDLIIAYWKELSDVIT